MELKVYYYYFAPEDQTRCLIQEYNNDRDKELPLLLVHSAHIDGIHRE